MDSAALSKAEMRAMLDRLGKNRSLDSSERMDLSRASRGMENVPASVRSPIKSDVLYTLTIMALGGLLGFGFTAGGVAAGNLIGGPRGEMPGLVAGGLISLPIAFGTGLWRGHTELEKRRKQHTELLKRMLAG